MGRYFDLQRAVVEAHLGTVSKYTGDGVMAVFGIPEVAEDDAHRAVAAGLELQRRFVEIKDLIAGRHGVEVGLRVGINTGEVVIADADADIVGDPLNTAARLEAACAPGRVLVGEETWRLTRSSVGYEVLGEVSVKGKAEPIGTFQVMDVPVPAVDDSAIPFVGRAFELARVGEVFAEADATRTARMISVIGAPGVGKTRFAAEAVQQHAPDALLFDLRCERSGTATYAPVADLLRAATDMQADDGPDETRAALETLIPSAVPDRDRVLDLLVSLVGTAPARSTEESFFAVRRLIEILAYRQPMVIIVDDLQWAEPLFLDLLDYLVEWVVDAPVLVLALARPEIRDIRPAMAVAGSGISAALALEGLDARATEALAAQLLGTDRLPPGLVDRLPASTQGNPLFVRELIRMLVDDGVVSRSEDGWQMSVDASSVDVPPTIQSLLATRVERMPASERRVVELASVVGSEFPRTSVTALDETYSASHLNLLLGTLNRKELIEPTNTFWGNDDILRFHHVLIRDAAYRRLLKGNRAELHLLAGEWTEATSADLPGEYEATIGYHFEQSYRYRTELGLADEATEQVGRRAALLLKVAAERALECHDVEAAGPLAARALGCLQPAEPLRRGLLALTCEAFLESGDIASARSWLAEFDKIDDDPRSQAWAACFHGQLAAISSPDQLRSAEAAVNAAAEQLSLLGDQAGVAKARQVRAGLLGRLGQVAVSADELDRAIAAARLAGDHRRITAVLGAGPHAALWGPDPVARAGGRCLDFIRQVRNTTGAPSAEATSVRCQAVLEALRGGFDTARQLLAETRELGKELGLRTGLLETEFYAGIVELLAGEPHAAEPLLRDAIEGLQALGLGADAGHASAYLARTLLTQGRLSEAAEAAAAGEALAGQHAQVLIAVRAAQAEIAAGLGDLTLAQQRADEAVQLAEGRDIIFDHAIANIALARVRAAAGDDAGAQQALAAGQSLLDAKGSTVVASLDPTQQQAQAQTTEPSEEAGEGIGSNAASVASDHLCVVVLAGRLDDVPALFTPDALTGDRSIFGEGYGTRDDFVLGMRSWQALWAEGTPNNSRPADLRGNNHVLMDIRFGAKGNWSVDRLAVVGVNDDGLVNHMVFFDHEDHDLAVAHLDKVAGGNAR